MTTIVVRPTTPEEAPALAELHVASFESFYLTALGKAFLTRYYRAVRVYQAGISIGAYDGSRIVGVAAGFVNPSGFYAFLRRDRLRLATAAAPSLILRPSRLARFIRNYARTGALAARRAGETTAELASLGVHPGFTRRGVGEQLVGAFVSAARDRGALEVALTTDADGNDRVNRFYQRLGFRAVARVEAQPGRYLNEYRLDVAEGQR